MEYVGREDKHNGEYGINTPVKLHSINIIEGSIYKIYSFHSPLFRTKIRQIFPYTIHTKFHLWTLGRDRVVIGNTIVKGNIAIRCSQSQTRWSDRFRKKLDTTLLVFGSSSFTNQHTRNPHSGTKEATNYKCKVMGAASSNFLKWAGTKVSQRSWIKIASCWLTSLYM